MTARALAIPALVLLATSARADAPKRARAWPGSVSPDGKLGVTVPDADHVKPGAHQNQLVDVATGKVVATLPSETVFENESHADMQPRWSPDSSTLVWYVDGKWGSLALVVAHVERGRLKWQTDVRELAVQHLLKELRTAYPDAAAAVKKHGARGGGWFRDGLAIDVKPRPVDDDDDDAWDALGFSVDATSDPKATDDPDDYKVTAKLSVELAADGKLSFGTVRIAVTKPRSDE